MSTLIVDIDPKLIDADAVKVVRRLVRHHHEAYLVGGCVRDLLLGATPKDFDVATSATPNEMRGLFRNSRVIGRRFRLVHIFFGPKIIETATFRQNPRPENGDEDKEALLIRRDNVWGTAQDDALRRDFTLNGLFYDPVRGEVIDFVDGLGDLANRSIRTIGDPSIRFQEDPVRILRAIKFAARLDLDIETETYAALKAHRDQIPLCARARVLEEIYKLLREGSAHRALHLLEETGVLGVLLPELSGVESDPAQRELLHARLVALDSLKGEVEITNPVMLAAVYYDTLIPAASIFGQHRGDDEESHSLREALERWTPSRKDRDRTRQILMAQRRLRPAGSKKRRRKRPMALVTQAYFPEALALYKLLCHTGEADPSTIEKWESLYASTGRPDKDPGGRRPSRRRRRRRKPSKPRSEGGGLPS